MALELSWQGLSLDGMPFGFFLCACVTYDKVIDQVAILQLQDRKDASCRR